MSSWHRSRNRTPVQEKGSYAADGHQPLHELRETLRDAQSGRRHYNHCSLTRYTDGKYLTRVVSFLGPAIRNDFVIMRRIASPAPFPCRNAFVGVQASAC